MKSFTRLHNVLSVKKRGGDIKMNVVKFQKDGTKRVFFSVENDQGERVTRTMFARMYDAKNLAYKLI